MKGLSFSEPMMKAWIEGRKTVTRRLINKVNNDPWGVPGAIHPAKISGYIAWWPGSVDPEFTKKAYDYGFKPRYNPGETVYIKEKWRIGAWNEHENQVCIDYAADGYARKEWLSVPDPEIFEKIWIQSTDQAIKKGLKTDTDGQYHWEPGQGPTSWRSPMFMPEWASRSHALIKSVRPERVQDITEEEAIKEGVIPMIGKTINGWTPHVLEFSLLWDSIHPGSWEKNPWAWRYELECKS